LLFFKDSTLVELYLKYADKVVRLMIIMADTRLNKKPADRFSLISIFFSLI
jgi:hypothetical protein